MVSIKDVARDAGVSPQTVSNCINNPGIVKASTRAIVSASIARLGYTPNASARRLRMQRSNTIAVGIAPVTHSQVYDRLLHALATEADAHSIRVILYKTDSYQDEIRQFTALTAGGDVDAFVLSDTSHDDPRIDWLIEHRQTFVLFGRPWGLGNMFDPNVPWVDVDGKRGIADMTRLLILRGRKRIGFVGWPGISGTGNDRREGWRTAMLDARMASEDELERMSAQSVDEFSAGQDACRELLQRVPDIDAIICVSDTIAAGVKLALPPDADIAVTGFDNTPTARSMGLPTIDQPLAATAREIIRIIQERLNAQRGSSATGAGADTGKAGHAAGMDAEERTADAGAGTDTGTGVSAGTSAGAGTDAGAGVGARADLFAGAEICSRAAACASAIAFATEAGVPDGDATGSGVAGNGAASSGTPGSGTDTCHILLPPQLVFA